MTRRSSTTFGPLQGVIILATLFTAGVHLYLVVTPHGFTANMNHLFLLASIAYVGSLAALYLPFAFLESLRWLSRAGLLATTVATIIGYVVVVGWIFTPLSLIDKLVEVLLVILIVAETAMAYRDRRQTSASERLDPQAATAVPTSALGSTTRRSGERVRIDRACLPRGS